MKFSSRLDVDVVAHESTDEVALLVDLEAPALAEHEDRAPATVQVVLDRSGSMSGRPLAVAIQSLVDLVAKLDARDRFGVVIFDDKANVVVPCGPVDDKERIVAQVRSIVPGGMTCPPACCEVSGRYGAWSRQAQPAVVARPVKPAPRCC